MPGKTAAPSMAHTDRGAEPPATFAALAVPNFRRYVSGQALSLIGTWVETVAQALLVLKLTHSGTVLGLTTAARYAPILLLSPYAGLLVDRYSKRHVLLATQIGLGLVSAALGVTVLTGGIRLWQVVVLALVFGTLSAADSRVRSGRRGHCHLPHHGKLHHPTRRRAWLPRPGHRAVVDGPGRQHAHRRTDHRRAIRRRRAAVRVRPRSRRLPRRRDRRPLARRWPPPLVRLAGNKYWRHASQSVIAGISGCARRTVPGDGIVTGGQWTNGTEPTICRLRLRLANWEPDRDG